ncbi:FAD-dependent oxidoreductase, partial [Gordonia effusa]
MQQKRNAVNGSTESTSDFDVVVVGSGFGGSVAALRLSEKGYRVCVIEAGRRFADTDFADSAWKLHKLAFAPKLGMYGLYRVHLLRNVAVLAGAGVGGGSLNYGNTLYRPPAGFFEDRQWSAITDWRSELEPHYDQAERMLGVVTNPLRTYSDQIMGDVARDLGVSHTFSPTKVGVYFGDKGQRDEGQKGSPAGDPFFGGAGPDRVSCTECGSCMTGCRVGAKNTTIKNYLALAEGSGARIIDRTTVKSIEPLGNRWEVRTASSSSWGPIGPRPRTITADHVVVAAGTYNTQRLLHHSSGRGKLPLMSPRLGHLTRTNSESILCATRRRYDAARDTSQGIAITSSFYPRDDTHIEPVRFGPGFNAIGGLFTPLTDGDPGKARWRKMIDRMIAEPTSGRQMLSFRRRAQRSIIILVMQNRDNSLTTF